jgi:hypothetical protein
MQGKIELIKSDGTKSSIDLISLFNISINGTDKEFILLTADEVDQNGLIKIMAAEVKDGKLEKITDQSDWSEVKNAMRSIISSSKGNYTYINPGDVALSFVVGNDYARVIAVQDAAKAQLIKDYAENKPAPVIPEPEEKPEPEDPNKDIYPQDSADKSGDEVSPGIAEVDPNAPVSNPFETEPNLDTSSTTNEEPVVTPTEQVAEVEPAPLKDIVNNSVDLANDNENNQAARDVLINKIIAAVDEYIESTTSDKENLEISALKTNIESMQEQLKAMADTINTQE